MKINTAVDHIILNSFIDLESRTKNTLKQTKTIYVQVRMSTKSFLKN